MKEIKTFILKDLCLNAKGVAMYLVSIVIFPLLIDAKLGIGISSINVSGIFSTVVFLAGICYMEDNDETRQFLKSIPVHQKKMIGARYILTFALIIFSSIACGIILGFDMVLLSLSIELLCFGGFLLLYYWLSFNIAQGAIVAGIIGSILLEKLEFYDNLICLEMQEITFIGSVIMYAITFFLASR